MYYDDELEQKRLEAEFLAVSEKVAPAVCGDLRGEPLDLYKEIAPLAPTEWEQLKAFSNLPKVEALCDRIETWATRWNLTADWCKDAACSTLSHWAASGNTATGFWHPWAQFSMRERYLAPRLPTYEHELGRPKYLEVVKEYLDELLAPGGALEHYCATVEAELKTFTLKERRQLDRHVRWAAEVHLKIKRRADIVIRDNVERSTVTKAVNDILKTLRLMN